MFSAAKQHKRFLDSRRKAPLARNDVFGNIQQLENCFRPRWAHLRDPPEHGAELLRPTLAPD